MLLVISHKVPKYGPWQDYEAFSLHPGGGMGGENRMERHRVGGHARTCQHCQEHKSSSPGCGGGSGKKAHSSRARQIWALQWDLGTLASKLPRLKKKKSLLLKLWSYLKKFRGVCECFSFGSCLIIQCRKPLGSTRLLCSHLCKDNEYFGESSLCLRLCLVLRRALQGGVFSEPLVCRRWHGDPTYNWKTLSKYINQWWKRITLRTSMG